MITKIHIKDKATIKDVLIEPLKINYFFGGNGTGKTTISKFLSNKDNYSTNIIEKNDDYEILVYNKDFVDNNFQDKNAIHGIFTIGESAVDAEKQIAEQENIKREKEKDKETKEKSLAKLQTEINQAEEKFDNDCWEVQKEIGESFASALSGARGNKKIFSKKCYDSFSGMQSAEKQENLLQLYQQLFAATTKEYSKLPDFSCDLGTYSVNDIESHSVFLKKIVQSSESNLSLFIDSVGNIDWVNQGVHYIRDNQCPFCQRVMNEEILHNLEQLFDKTYTDSVNLIRKFKSFYELYSENLENYYNNILTSAEKILFIDKNAIKENYKAFRDIINKNMEAINEKLAHPALEQLLTNTKIYFENFVESIRCANNLIENNNKMLKNRQNERKTLTEKLWDFIANNKLRVIINSYKKDIEGKNKGVLKLKLNIDTIQQSINDCEEKIKELRSKVVCIDNTISEINSLLLGFGFKGFKIEKKDDMYYKLIRQDGTEVKETLSEGEHRFITFLYFYQLVKGTLERSSVNKGKIIIIDDPISSLDSNILFIVSYLVRELINNCLSNKNIKQIFVLTHNIYFHQEITYHGSRANPSPKEERFWILHKVNEVTIIKGYEKNQISSSYELLWQEYRNPNTDASLICNTMRRILEHYFNVIGHHDYNSIIDQFTGQDRLICKSLLPFINTGSHLINDDFHLSVDPDMVDKYKEVFRIIFQKANQESHYNMMMGIE